MRTAVEPSSEARVQHRNSDPEHQPPAQTRSKPHATQLRWMDVTLWVGHEHGSRDMGMVGSGFRAVLPIRLHTMSTTPGLDLHVTCAWPDQRFWITGDGSAVEVKEPQPLLRQFVARTVQEVAHWLMNQDEPEQVHLWVHVWNPRAMGKMLSHSQQWCFERVDGNLFDVRAGGQELERQFGDAKRVGNLSASCDRSRRRSVRSEASPRCAAEQKRAHVQKHRGHRTSEG